MNAALVGKAIHANELLEVGQVVVGARFIVMHPLDVIALKFGTDVLGRLAAVQEYFIERTHRHLDDLLVRLQVPTTENERLIYTDGAHLSIDIFDHGRYQVVRK